MLTVGITGGIGSGKSVVVSVFSTLGIPVFIADEAARYLMEHDATLIKNIISVLGEDVYAAGKLDRQRVSDAIFHDSEKLARMNSFVHPATIAYSKRWKEQQNAPYLIKESALFYESGSYTEMDIMVGVYCPEEVRIRRTMARSMVSDEKVRSIMHHQMNEDEKTKKCDFVIINDEVSPVLPQVLRCHQILLDKAWYG